jgi:YVTN family beta-propeller protein
MIKSIRTIFVVALAIVLIVGEVVVKLPAIQSELGTAEPYLSPIELAFSPDGHLLYVACEGSDELRVLDVQSGEVVRSVRVGRVPRGIALSPDGRRIYVTNSWSDTVTEIDSATLKTVRNLPAGFEPIGVVTDQTGKTLYVANRLSNDVSVIDLSMGREITRLPAGRGASYLALSLDGKQLFCTHIYPNIGNFRTQPNSEITVIDTASRTVVERKQLHSVAGVFHVAIARDGKLGVAALLRPKNLIPLAHVEHGWAFGNSVTLFGEDVGGTVQVPIDELDRYYSLPWGVVITPDKSKIFLSTAASESITVISVPKLLEYVHAHPGSFANDLSASANYVSARISVGHNPRGALLSPDGSRLYVANRLDDNISVIDTSSESVVATIDLGGPKTINSLRRGEQLFYTADFAFQGQFGCSNCHLDATIDGLQWNLDPSGFGQNIVDTRSIEDLAGTEPFGWSGSNPDMRAEIGPRPEKYFFRSQSFNNEQLTDLAAFVYSLPFRPNRYRSANGRLTPAQERGKAIFERTKYKTRASGNAIPVTNQCPYCHSGVKYTSQRKMDVGTGKSTDSSALFDVPQLRDVVYSAPYLHDGSARSLEEIWTKFNPKDQHGVTNDLTIDELHDLIEYLKTL